MTVRRRSAAILLLLDPLALLLEQRAVHPLRPSSTGSRRPSCFLSDDELRSRAEGLTKSGYGSYLLGLLAENGS